MTPLSATTNQELRRESGRRTFRYVAIAVAALLILMAVHFATESRSERSLVEASERLNTQLGRLSIVKSLEGVVADLLYLADQQQRFTGASSPGGLNELSADLLAFANRQGIYDQVRFIDRSGRERVRINYRDGVARIVPGEKLQDKSDRYYVRESMHLVAGRIYVSPFDLNVERGKVEIPAKPVIRFSTPVFDAQGRRQGILVLNYLGALLLDAFRESSANIGEHVHLLNASGYWLVSPNRADEWGFMRGQEEHFGTRYPAIWKSIRAAEKGQFEAQGFMVSFTTVRAMEFKTDTGQDLKAPATRAWKIVSLLPLSGMRSSPEAFLKRHYPLYLIMLLLLVIAGVLLGRSSARHRFAEARLLFERGFRDVLQGMSLNVVALDAQGRITFENATFRNLVDRQTGELEGCDWVETLVAPESRALCRSRIAAVIDDGAVGEHSSWLLTRNGERRLIAWHETPISNSDGGVTGLTLIGEEITEGHEAAERAALLSRAIEQSPATVMITDAHGAIEYVNPKFTELTGYEFDEVRGRNPRFLKSGHTQDADYTRLWETISMGGEWRGILCNRKKNGELYWEDAVLCGVRNLEGAIAHFIAIKVDITAQRRLQQRFRHCVEAAPYALILTDRFGRMVLVNQQTEEMFGYRRSELLGQSVEMLIPENLRSAHEHKRLEFMTTGASRIMGSGRDVIGLQHNGSEFPAEIGLHSFDTEEGRMSLATVTNICERKRLESEIAWRDRQLAQNNALVAVGRMANMVAHDISNPLSSIKMGLQIISKHECLRQDAEARELNSIALEQVGFVEEVVEDLMTYSREVELNPRWLDLRQVMESSLVGVQRRFTENSVELVCDYQDDLPAVRADRTRLRRAFSNLIMNALDATASLTERAAKIHIRLSTQDNGRQQIRVDVSDNAGGIAEADRDRIFEPFFTTREQGTGLGLAITRRIVEQHGGRLEIARGEANGTRATIYLPIDPAMSGETMRADRVLDAEVYAAGTFP